jgi:hypothetical protein
MLEKFRERVRKGDKSQMIPDKLNFPGGTPDYITFDVELQPPTSYV